MAEVGVYQGVSAKLICEAKGDKELHVFDTFEGLPDKSGTDVPALQAQPILSAAWNRCRST